MRQTMSRRSSSRHAHWLRLPAAGLMLLASAATLAVSGCSPDEAIVTYTVAKPKPRLSPEELTQLRREIDPNAPEPEIPEVPQVPEGHPPIGPGPAATGPSSTGEPQQMLAAITIHDGVGWFFKLQGPPAEVSGLLKPFTEFLKTLKFNADGKPEWQAPAGWAAAESAQQMRFATLRIPTSTVPLELTVIPLPYSGGDRTGYILANVNRWRGQVGLGALAPAALFTSNTQTEEVQETTLNGMDFVLVNIQGTGSGGGMGGAPFAPFAGGARRPAGPIGPAEPTAGTAEPKAPVPNQTVAGIDFTTPAGWSPGVQNQFSKAAFVVEEADRKVQITVSDLPGNSGSMLDNVNRWRGQVMLPAVDESQLAKVVQPVAVDGQSGAFVELTGTEQAILGVVVSAGGRTWYIKLHGDSALAAKQKQNFDKFVASIRFKSNKL